jgi:hypothetical protein
MISLVGKSATICETDTQEADRSIVAILPHEVDL